MKFTLKGYWEPTPKGVRKIADSILAGATLASGFTMTDHPKIAAAIMIISVVCKIVSNFFTEDTTNN